MALSRLQQVAIGIAVGAALLSAAVAGYDLMSGGSIGLVVSPASPIDPAPIEVAISGERMAIPANLIRFSAERHPGAHARVDLALLLPELTGQTAATAAEFLKPAHAGRLVFITIAPTGEALDSGEMLATVYQRYLETAETARPDGLLRRSFKRGTSYAGEDLYFEPGSVHPFVVRCFAETTDTSAVTCMRDVRIGAKLMATIRLPAAELGRWRSLSEQLDAILGRFFVKM